VSNLEPKTGNDKNHHNSIVNDKTFAALTTLHAGTCTPHGSNDAENSCEKTQTDASHPMHSQKQETPASQYSDHYAVDYKTFFHTILI
jgi:hypothetical protein